MPANDEFPRGWFIENDQSVGGATASVTLAGVPGVSHVITLVEWTWASFTGAANSEAQVQLVLGATVSPIAYSAVQSGGGVGIDRGSWAGPLAAPPGQAIQARFSASIAAFQRQYILIHGYDI